MDQEHEADLGYIWEHENAEAVRLAAEQKLETLGLAVPRGEVNFQVSSALELE